jgi:hypothetical protein
MKDVKKNPDAGVNLPSGSRSKTCGDAAFNGENTTQVVFSKPVMGLHVRAGGNEYRLKGREAWALANLINAGETGVTPISHPAPRWSAYICRLRAYGDFEIETVRESHGGPYSGHHARYVLRSPVCVIDVTYGGTT